MHFYSFLLFPFGVISFDLKLKFNNKVNYSLIQIKILIFQGNLKLVYY